MLKEEGKINIYSLFPREVKTASGDVRANFVDYQERCCSQPLLHHAFTVLPSSVTYYSDFPVYIFIPLCLYFCFKLLLLLQIHAAYHCNYIFKIPEELRIHSLFVFFFIFFKIFFCWTEIFGLYLSLLNIRISKFKFLTNDRLRLQ